MSPDSLARWQFASTTIYHFIFVPISIGLALLATMPPLPSVLDVTWRMALCGLGFGFFQAPNNRTLLAAAPRSSRQSGRTAIAPHRCRLGRSRL